MGNGDSEVELSNRRDEAINRRNTMAKSLRQLMIENRAAKEPRPGMNDTAFADLRTELIAADVTFTADRRPWTLTIPSKKTLTITCRQGGAFLMTSKDADLAETFANINELLPRLADLLT